MARQQRRLITGCCLDQWTGPAAAAPALAMPGDFGHRRTQLRQQRALETRTFNFARRSQLVGVRNPATVAHLLQREERDSVNESPISSGKMTPLLIHDVGNFIHGWLSFFA